MVPALAPAPVPPVMVSTPDITASVAVAVVVSDLMVWLALTVTV